MGKPRANQSYSSLQLHYVRSSQAITKQILTQSNVIPGPSELSACLAHVLVYRQPEKPVYPFLADVDMSCGNLEARLLCDLNHSRQGVI